MYVSHYHAEKLPFSDEVTFFATLWVLVYPDGIFHTWNKYELDENVFFLLECGGHCDVHHFPVHVTKDRFPDVFNACLHRQSESALYEQSL